MRVADYITSSTVFTYFAPAAGTLGRLTVDFPVNLEPADASTLWQGPWRWAIYEVQSATLALELSRRGVELLETMAVAPMLEELKRLQL